MRLHRLEISAFGPFAGNERIDFDALAEHGLFLLNGPTGAGKTSILDAVCFALYGSLPGARQGSKALKSHHAAAEAEPSVLLEFTAQGRRFEVRRSPEWSRPSARSSAGWVIQKASTHVRELSDGEWRPLTSRNDEAGALLGDVLGMAREQFTRVVLLPQGEFASFLRAKASERVDLLEKLFGTQRFAEVEAQLGVLAQSARTAAEIAEQAAVAHVMRLEAEVAAHAGPSAGVRGFSREDSDHPGSDHIGSDHTGSDHMGPGHPASVSVPALDPDAPVEPAHVRAMFAWADEAFGWQHEVAAEERETANKTVAAARAEAEALERALEDTGELELARARKAAWEAGAGEHLERNRRLAGHRAASSLRAALTEADRSSKVLATATVGAFAALEAAAAVGWTPEPRLAAPLGAAGEPGTGPGTGDLWDPGTGRGIQSDEEPLIPAVEEARRAASSASADAAVLAERVSVERELTELEARVGADRALLAAATARATAFAESADALDAELAALEEERARLEPAAAALAVSRFEAESAEAVVTAVQEHGQALRTVNEAEMQYDGLRAAALNARQSWLELRERRLEQTAAELAAHLAEGAPCPVCGSPEHPAPAVGAQNPLLLVDAERAAARESEAAVEDERRARDAVASARARLAGVDARGGATDPDKAVRLLEEKLAGVQRAVEAQARLTLITGRRGGLVQRRDTALAGRDEASALRIRAEESVLRASEEVERRRAEVEVLRAGFATVEARRVDVAARARTLGALADSLIGHRNAEVAKTRAAEILSAALAETEFQDEAAARSALMDAADAARAESQASDYDAEGQRLSGLFGSAAVRRALAAESGGVAPSRDDLARLRASEGEAERRLRDADLAATDASGARKRCLALRERFEDSVPALEKTRARSHALGELARTARGQGDNERRMSLHSYVLAARLEQVATAATERLLAMSDGRFSLEHSDALAARGAASGLGLEVVDGWTGQKRDPSTLSGGESFMASLALALALADVVQHESGGIDIETLFVDEGFGSLDEQALEQVMDAIEGLRAGGRVVGLVSHVPELKQRIPAQIRVSKGRDGSHVESVGLVPAVPA
ncbi:AAA family ATPase [Sinomonas sp. P10A9]|uniref:Nuclease SbcCD subunit C n=1 Tax=Sinomonas puerhi TaxID=3238584 RepID=A0AB39KYY0_9MICC